MNEEPLWLSKHALEVAQQRFDWGSGQLMEHFKKALVLGKFLRLATPSSQNDRFAVIHRKRAFIIAYNAELDTTTLVTVFTPCKPWLTKLAAQQPWLAKHYQP